jgi:serine/threonine-protein kinase RsbW
MVVLDDAAPFNPLEAPAPDTAEPLETRSPGGLGIALIRQLMDVVEYDRLEVGNRLRLRRRLTGAGAE